MASGRWVLVTGASSGIGRDLARAFAAEGDGLVLTARRQDRIEALASELEGRHGVPARAIPLDLADPAAPDTLQRQLAADGIALHTLVNNAGFGQRGRFDQLPADRQLAMVQLNVVALTALCRIFLPGMIERRSGGILNVASMAAFQAGPFMAVYYATKAYVLSLSEALHEEAKPFGVTVTALCPGPVETEFGAVAGMRGVNIPSIAMVPSEAVARAGLEGYRKGQAVVVPGGFNKAAVGFGHLLPRALTRRATAAVQRPR